MECIEAIKGRRSIRRFKDQQVERELVGRLLDAAQMAPSAGNLQARDFIVISDQTSKQKLAKAAMGQSFIEQAPLVVVVIANIERSSRVYKSRGELYAIQDAAAGIENLLLAAHSLGLGACLVGAFDQVQVSALLGVPNKMIPVAIIPLGYPDERPSAPPRMVQDRLVHWEKW